MIKGAKSIAEFAIRRHLQWEGLVLEYFELTMYGNEAEIKDYNGNTIWMVYDPETRTVYEK